MVRSKGFGGPDRFALNSLANFERTVGFVGLGINLFPYRSLLRGVRSTRRSLLTSAIAARPSKPDVWSVPVPARFLPEPVHRYTAMASSAWSLLKAQSLAAICGSYRRLINSSFTNRQDSSLTLECACVK